MTEEGKSESEAFTVSRLTDVVQPFQWHSLKIPGLEKLEPRVGHSIVTLKHGEIIMIGGGNHNGPLQELFTINLQPSSVEEVDDRVKEHPARNDFSARYEFSCAKDNEDNVWIFGGADVQNTMNEVFMINAESVVEVVPVPHDGESEEKVTRPSPRTQGNNSALVDWKGKQYMAVFAGGLKGEQAVEDRNLYLFDLSEYAWDIVNVNTDEKVASSFPFACQPPAVQGQVMTAIGSKVLLHGGINGLALYGGLHWIDLEKTNENSTTSWIDLEVEMLNQPKPEPRAAHGIARVCDVDKSSSVIYIFGGLGEKGALNDLWSFNIESKSWNQILVKNEVEEDCKQQTICPGPRLDFAMCCVGLRDEDSGQLAVFLIVHGGMNPKGEIFKDMWVMKLGELA